MTDLKLIEQTGWTHYACWSWETGIEYEDFHIQKFKISKHQYDEVNADSPLGDLITLCAAFTPTKCDRCDSVPKIDGRKPSLMSEAVYDTPDGTSDRPGDMWYSDSDSIYCGFQNCDKKHLQVRLPDGSVWDTDSRAANCAKPDDVVHRCWVKHTENGVENMTIDKNGDTCEAGGGSILQENWHGFIRKGMLIKA